MLSTKILETERLILREFTLTDADFIIHLVNSPNWLEFIGDKNIKSKTEAEDYIEKSLLKSYQTNEYGLLKVELKDINNTPIGMCGLVNRDILDDVDIGFAMLPEYMNFGYGFEIANATLNYAKQSLNIDRVVAITDAKNMASIKLLNKIGLTFEKTLKLSETDAVLVFSPSEKDEDEKQLTELTDTFFNLFTNKDGKQPNVKRIHELFIPEGVIISNNSNKPDVYNLESFIAPREKILTDGTLTDFSEQEIFYKTEIYGTIAQRFCLYEKSGKLNGAYFEAKGMKSIQFVKANAIWKMSAVIWCDEKEKI